MSHSFSTTAAWKMDEFNQDLENFLELEISVKNEMSQSLSMKLPDPLENSEEENSEDTMPIPHTLTLGINAKTATERENLARLHLKISEYEQLIKQAKEQNSKLEEERKLLIEETQKLKCQFSEKEKKLNSEFTQKFNELSVQKKVFERQKQVFDEKIKLQGDAVLKLDQLTLKIENLKKVQTFSERKNMETISSLKSELSEKSETILELEKDIKRKDYLLVKITEKFEKEKLENLKSLSQLSLKGT